MTVAHLLLYNLCKVCKHIYDTLRTVGLQPNVGQSMYVLHKYLYINTYISYDYDKRFIPFKMLMFIGVYLFT